MGKTKHEGETEDDKRVRKRAKKDAKQAKRQSMESQDTPEGELAVIHSVTTVNASSLPCAVTESLETLSKSAFEQKKLRMVISLFPGSLDDLLSHLRQSVRSLLLKYSDGVGGVLLAFENVKIVGDGNGSMGLILNEMPHIHYLIEIDALVFCPNEGVRITGVVNECFPSHIGMLVCSFFNAMVPAEDLRFAGYVFDQDLQQWLLGEKPNVLGINDRVNFTVKKLRECAGIISLEGSRPSAC